MRKLFISTLLFVTLFLQGNCQEEKFISISIYNFTRMVDWPSNMTGKDFVIDVIGHKSVYEKLKELCNGRKAGNRTIVVRYLESTEGISQSDILFVGFWQSKEMSKIVDKVGNSHTLLVAEKDGMTDTGAGINFVIRNDVIKFEVKPGNIQRYGLKVSDDLLKLAYKVY